MRIVFMGSPAFALPALRALAASRHEVVAVVTQPDRPAGRGRTATPPPAKLEARRLGFDVLQPDNVSAPESVERLQELAPDVIVVAAYGQILRRSVLEVPKRGSLNVHASLLPKYRGASPIAAAILEGEDVTGVTIMEVVRALDAGPMVASVEEPISPHDTTASLEARLSGAGASLLLRVIDDWAGGRIQATPQDDSQATYAPMVKRADAVIDWSEPAERVWREVRAFNPWPVSHTFWRGQELKIWEAWPLPGGTAQPGTVAGVESLPAEARGGRGVVVQAGEGRLALMRVQLPGRKALDGAEFVRGQRDLIGARLGEAT
jgi:methionyl-tRNA formyltransferase